MNDNLNARPDILIDWFDDFAGYNPYSFLSNFATGYPIEWRGHTFATTEQAFAFAKVDPMHPDAPRWEAGLLDATDPGDAKALGRSCPMRPDWDAVKYSIMREIVWEKFTQHPTLERSLIDTGTAYLQEGTYWNDRIWGVDLMSSTDPFQRVGWNMLGAILMETRARITAIEGWWAA